MDLDAWSACLKVLADPTRVRLLALLEREELTVAELSGITRLAQPRVSTHLAKLKEADLVRDRRAGVSAYYRFNAESLDPAEGRLWEALRDSTDDPLLRQDAERLPAILESRRRVLEEYGPIATVVRLVNERHVTGPRPHASPVYIQSRRRLHTQPMPGLRYALEKLYVRARHALAGD